MVGFEKIRVQGFRRLLDVDLGLQPLNVLIGGNGSGKTSLLDVFSLLAASASGRLNETVSDLGGIDANLTNLRAAIGGKSSFIAFQLAMAAPEHNPIEYRIALSPRGVGYEISDESLAQQRGDWPQPFKHIEVHHSDVRYYEQRGTKKGLFPPNWEHNPTESALSQVPKMFREPEDFRKRLASSTHYHVLDVSRRAPIRLPRPRVSESRRLLLFTAGNDRTGADRRPPGRGSRAPAACAPTRRGGAFRSTFQMRR